MMSVTGAVSELHGGGSGGYCIAYQASMVTVYVGTRERIDCK